MIDQSDSFMVDHVILDQELFLVYQHKDQEFDSLLIRQIDSSIHSLAPRINNTKTLGAIRE